jgi:molecular chaperone DnaJ
VVEDRCETCGGSGQKQTNKKLKITVPAGVENGTRLRVSGEGDAGKRNGPSGDLYVYLVVNEESKFRREGIDIHSDLNVSYLQAILGCELEVETVDGKVAMQVPAGTQPGTVLSLDGRGVPRLGNPVSRGKHLITVKVDIPTRVKSEERELLTQLAEIRGDLVGKNKKEGFLGGLFNG